MHIDAHSGRSRNKRSMDVYGSTVVLCRSMWYMADFQEATWPWCLHRFDSTVVTGSATRDCAACKVTPPCPSRRQHPYRVQVEKIRSKQCIQLKKNCTMESMESLPRAAAGLSTTVATASDSASPSWRNMSLSLSVVTRDFSCLETDSESCNGRCFRWTYSCLYAIVQMFKPLHLSLSLEAKVENEKNEACVTRIT